MTENNNNTLIENTLDKKKYHKYTNKIKSLYDRHKTDKERKKALSKITFQQYLSNKQDEIFKRNNLVKFFCLYVSGKKRVNYSNMAKQYLNINFIINPKYINQSIDDQRIYIELVKKVARYFGIIYKEFELEID